MTKRRVWITPKLTHLNVDEMWHQSLDDALKYIQDNLVEWIGCEFSEEELIEDGFTFKLTARLVSQENWDDVFIHKEIIES